MAELEKARVFRNGRSQAVRIPAKYRFAASEVYVRRDKATGDLILSEGGDRSRGWETLLKTIAANPLPESYLADREQGVEAEREEPA